MKNKGTCFNPDKDEITNPAVTSITIIFSCSNC